MSRTGVPRGGVRCIQRLYPRGRGFGRPWSHWPGTHGGSGPRQRARAWYSFWATEAIAYIRKPRAPIRIAIYQLGSTRPLPFLEEFASWMALYLPKLEISGCAYLWNR